MAIISPLDIGAAGVEALLRTIGGSVAGRWRQVAPAIASPELHQASVLIIARRLLPATAEGATVRPLADCYRGKIIVLLEPEDAFSTREFIDLDVEGLILSTATVADLTECVTSVGRGRRWVDPDIRALLGQAQRRPPDYHELSSRELEVARLAAAGLSNKRIARALNVSDGTVKMHMHHILAKLRLSSRIDLIWSFNEAEAHHASEQRDEGLCLVDEIPGEGQPKIAS